jgi:hypothetical protein
MPLLGIRGAASPSAFGFLASVGGNNWLLYYPDNSSPAYTANANASLAIGSDNKVYLTSTFYTTSNTFISAFNSSGTNLWQNSTTAGCNSSYTLSTDSSGNLYFGGGYANSAFYLTKYNSSGTNQWQVSLWTRNTSPDCSAQTYVKVDSSGNPIISIMQGFSNTGYAYNWRFGPWFVAKYNSSGALQWSQGITGNSVNYCGVVYTDSSNNVYAVGNVGYYYEGDSTGDVREVFYPYIIKFNSSGVVQWQRIINSENVNVYSVVADSSGNVYVSTLGGNILKLNSSGALVSQTKFSVYVNSGLYLEIDSSDNIYCFGKLTYASDFLMIKLNTSLSIQLQRGLTAPGYSCQFRRGAVGSDGNYVFTGSFYGGANQGYGLLAAKLPTDGSKTGTYTCAGVSFVYAASSVTQSTPSYSVSSSGLTISSSFPTDVYSNPTLGTFNYTSTLKKI